MTEITDERIKRCVSFAKGIDDKFLSETKNLNFLIKRHAELFHESERLKKLLMSVIVRLDNNDAIGKDSELAIDIIVALRNTKSASTDNYLHMYQARHFDRRYLDERYFLKIAINEIVSSQDCNLGAAQLEMLLNLKLRYGF
jgi:hypothetical protein